MTVVAAVNVTASAPVYGVAAVPALVAGEPIVPYTVDVPVTVPCPSRYAPGYRSSGPASVPPYDSSRVPPV